MKLQPQLYIDISGNPLGEPVFERVEFFDFESIEVTSTIQDIRDIAKVFTDYSQSFSIPASRVNNRIFKHYYNTNVSNGFDARIKQKAEIHLNGIKWKSGFVRLTKSIVKNGRPNSYRVTFFGGLTTLSNVIGNAKLEDLSTLDKYNHDYDIDTVYDGFKTGLQLSGTSMVEGTTRDVVYPSISVSDKWFYDSSAASSPTNFNQGKSINLYDPFSNGAYGIDYVSLKPAIKVKHIISAIEEKYSSIDFSDDFFGSIEFDDLYMLLHNNKGVLAPKSSSVFDTSLTYVIGTNSNTDFSLDAGSTENRPMITRFEGGFMQVDVQQYHLILDISNVTKAGGGTDPEYTVEFLEGTTVIDRFSNLEGDSTVTSVLCTQNQKSWDNVSVRISSISSELSNFNLDLEIKQVRYRMSSVGTTVESLCDVSNFSGVPDTESSLYSVSTTQTLLQSIEITKNMPKIGILEFLTGIFKMFNLTAKTNEDGVIVVKPLNDFYEDGATIDITEMINNEEVSVNRMDLFKNIEFDFAEKKTFGVINNDELSQTDFGNLEYQATSDGTDSSLVFDGKDYKVKLPFEKIYYERLSDEGNLSVRTEFGQGWLVDKDQNEVLTNPILFWNISQDVETTYNKLGFKDKGVITQYNRASNSNSTEYYSGAGFATFEGTKSVNFNTEYDEFTFSEVSGSLFKKYYTDYITTVFDKNTRIFELEMKASLSFLLSYKVNDTLTIKGDEFLINSIRTNLTTGITKMELILKFFVEEFTEPIGALITTPTGLSEYLTLTDSIYISWDSNPANQLAKGYKIYVDSVLVDTILLQTSYQITGLSPSTSYDIQISAYNAQGDESSLSSVLTVTTTSSTSQAPSPPHSLVADSTSYVSADISWTAGSGGFGSVSFEVFKDGSLLSTETSTSSTVALVSGVYSDFKVRAKDQNGNYSSFSNTLSIRGRTL